MQFRTCPFPSFSFFFFLFFFSFLHSEVNDVPPSGRFFFSLSRFGTHEVTILGVFSAPSFPLTDYLEISLPSRLSVCMQGW
ncbi:hypothetical protein QBC38DRAFT_475052 [Podospora fimiseda]|uniref:Secreted protein n=1 Tax=Podospora fimiseda TaxID=252190 RepID=A0AAN7H1B4_9PEZI|nr:hypothetical protein QBC38DRAFT_475052 [Podospora fimiseda]